MLDVKQSLETLAWLRCKARSQGEGTGNVCLSDCVCKGTGLRFYWLTKECTVLLFHLPESICQVCSNRGRTVLGLDALQMMDLAPIAPELGYQLMVQYCVDRRICQPLKVTAIDDDKEAAVLALAQVLEHATI